MHFKKRAKCITSGMNLSGEANALNNIGGTYNAFGETRKP